MSTATMALVFGVVFLIGAISGFFPSPPPADALPLRVDHGHGLALGLLPINTLHNIVHLTFGILGLAAARGALMTPTSYFQLVAVAYTVLIIMGLTPATQTTFGLVPLYGNDVWFHLLLAAPAAYFGFLASEPIGRRS
ncbi:MAG: DUF4383 domain-containing protein [Acidobacteria bacterium]|nr:DUF4383 domain-containing protein [Acidobacteriota bacterium]